MWRLSRTTAFWHPRPQMSHVLGPRIQNVMTTQNDLNAMYDNLHVHYGIDASTPTCSYSLLHNTVEPIEVTWNLINTKSQGPTILVCVIRILCYPTDFT